MSKLHKVFISYHHELDENHKRIFELRFDNSFGALISAAVNLGDIDPTLTTETIRQKIRDEHLRDSSVTVVLVGKLTWQRKHVDWEISSTIRDTELNPRGGLLGILLPSYYEAYFGGQSGKYDPYTIPPRLYDNVKAGYAKLYRWSEDPNDVQAWVHEAYLQKSKVLPDNGRDLFARNHSGERWQ
jgi:antiphage defense system Thoeris ThsB-like protein